MNHQRDPWTNPTDEPGAAMPEPTAPNAHEPWEDLMIAVLDGRAAAGASADLDLHLRECPPCRSSWEEYRRLFSGLIALRGEESPIEFWDDLARDVELRVAAEAGADAHADIDVEADADSEVLDLDDHLEPRERWSGVMSGLLAAGVAVLVLAGLYLGLPRSGTDPQAFTTRPTRDRAVRGEPRDPAALATAVNADESGASADEGRMSAGAGEREPLLGRRDALGGASETRLEVETGTTDPLAGLADADRALQGLTPAEAEELLSALEAQT